MRFEPDTRPGLVIHGFTAGILRIVWERLETYAVTGRDGLIYLARIIECDTDRNMISTEILRAALHGLVVQSPSGALARITGVEAHCTINRFVGEQIGILLVPVDQP